MGKTRKQLFSRRRSSRKFSRKQRGGNPPLDDKTTFIYDVIARWKKEGGFIKKPNAYNFYLSCENEDNYNHHIHIILTDNSNEHRYLYKRNGKQDSANGQGYSFFNDSRNYCMEEYHPPLWNVKRWTAFLYERMCMDTTFGKCD